MKTITMLEFRRNAAGVLRRIANGEHLVLSHRGKPAARLEPIRDRARGPGADDLFLAIGRRATDMFPDLPAALELAPDQQRRYLFNKYREYLERSCKVAPI